MANANPTEPGGLGLCAHPDERTQARVLNVVLSLCPETMTLGELIREVTAASNDFEKREQAKRAVRDLAAVGLLHREGELVLATRAAVNYYLLSQL